MKLMLDADITPSIEKISYEDKILMIGSCFSEEVGNKLKSLKFRVLQNPNGILYDPYSISESLLSYIDNTVPEEEDVFNLNDLWHSWKHHSRFSAPDKTEAIEAIKASRQEAHGFIQQLNWLIISPGTAFHYILKEGDKRVANCHKASSQLFKKELMTVDVITEQLMIPLKKLTDMNPQLRLVLTVSPVRHIRDGVVSNNLSKARLLESVHALVQELDNAIYFPAYDLLIDVLRDYRFYKRDLVHPNDIAVDFIFQKFTETFMTADTIQIMMQIEELQKSMKHRPLHAVTESFKMFKKNQLQKVKDLQTLIPSIDLSDEITYFSGA